MPKGYKGREKTERLHMLISPEELEAVDNWQHANKVATRSDAMRRLVQIGMRTVRSMPSIVKDVAEVLDLAAEATDIPEQVLAGLEVEDAPQVEVDKVIAHRLYDSVNFVFNRQIEAQDNLFRLLVEIAPLINNPALSEAIKDADRLAAEEYPNEEILLAIGASRKVQLEWWRKRRDKIQAQRQKAQEKREVSE
ncbi:MULTISPECIES: hypothetical protein [unclassified Mesorhizobium]|uniref:hypothetical protein n=1 Tax=unclassified Mesorhizobium TaxID=325217 RepID=UPI000FCC5169|nr:MULTISPECIES: hypothetical protein [unclassified Mesorhizobium]RUX97253.1 hypothetical protein EN993_04375 [Mesorhizobium sp. M7D.F.Ca.US.004.01.2.1]RVA35049.1 hypothetical protein EN935_05095 [Mesorhizobium sp. M7D.F.Ca.US.004.03.1.1]